MADIFNPEYRKKMGWDKDLPQQEKAADELSAFLQENRKKRRGVMSPKEMQDAGLTNNAY
ncbi:hypothetical protein ACWJJH_14215 [Endozoicomonadaceae bacterium StTr2]